MAPEKPQQLMLAAPKTSLYGSEHEMRSYQFFHERTLEQIMSLAHNDFWNVLVLQVAHQEPPIRHALVALSEFHRNFVQQPGPQAVAAPHFALQHYNTAIGQVLRAVDNHDSLYLRLICCLMFVSIECVQGNYSAALQLFKSGRTLFYRAQAGLVEGQTAASARQIRDKLRAPFVNLEYQIHAMLGEFDPAIPHAAFVDHELEVPAASDRFEDSGEAWEAYGKIKRVWLHQIHRPPVDGELIANLLARWRVALDALVRRRKFDAPEQRCWALLETDFRLFKLVTGLAAAAGAPDGGWTEETLQDVRELVDFAEMAVLPVGDEPPSAPFFSFDIGINVTLYTVAVMCRDPTIRRRAIAILDSTNRQEGLWNGPLAARLARRIVLLEENGRLVRCAQDVPPSARVCSAKVEFDDHRCDALLRVAHDPDTVHVVSLW